MVWVAGDEDFLVLEIRWLLSSGTSTDMIL